MNSGSSNARAMDPASNDTEPKHSELFGWTSSACTSFRRSFLNISQAPSLRVNDDIEGETASLDGDTGDWAVHGNRRGSGSLRFSFEYALGNRTVVPVQEVMLQSSEFWHHDPEAQNAITPASPLPEEITSPLPTVVQKLPAEKSQDKEEVLTLFWDYASYLLHLAVFGILGVLSRYLLEKLFGPSVGCVFSHQNVLYLDMPSNMIGSFLMGWFGVVFKGEISGVSHHLAVGLSTGYLGSLTTFSGWNQDMLDLSAHGRWLDSVFGFLLGMFIAAYSITFGIYTANGFRWLLQRININKEPDSRTKGKWRVDTFKRHCAVITILLAILAILWITSTVLLTKDFTSNTSLAELWLAFLVAPLGVWSRWFLARLNGRGLGKVGILSWFPFGTLVANVSATCIMAALATLKKAVDTPTCNTVASGIQLGFLGCLSTVSTFINEYNTMFGSDHPWRAFAYAVTTIGLAFVSGILIYNVPVWTKGYA